MDANGEKDNEVFQVYNETKGLTPHATDEARWSLFAWDRGADDGKGAPLKLTITLPQGLAQNRWLFYALYWNKDRVGMVVNDKEREIRKNISQLVFWIWEKLPSTSTQESNVMVICFVGANPSLVPWNSYDYKLAWYIPDERAIGGFLPKSLYQDKDFREKYNASITECAYWVLTWIENNGNIEERYEGYPGSVFPNNYRIFMKRYVKDASSQSKLLKLVQGTNRKKISEYLAASKGGAIVTLHDNCTEVQNFWRAGEKYDISPKVPYIHLGSRLKYVEQTNFRKQHWLTCPSHGTYANCRVYRLSSTDAAKNLAQDIYSQGRYVHKTSTDASFESHVSLGSSSHIHLGAVRYTAYFPQDCDDLEKESSVAQFGIEVNLYDAQGNKAGSSSKPEGEAINKRITSNFQYKVVFQAKNGSDKAVIAAPVLDDLTITYSHGCRFVEWR
jgi:hypothetical protein